MRNYLVFQLYGPMSAWGDIAVGETRPSTLSPAKSAVLGLMAAALGIRRPDTTADEGLSQRWEAEHLALAAGYGMAVKLTRPGLALTDYHTAQAPSSGTGRNRKVFATRRDELSWFPRHDLNTILSRRDYRQDAYAAIALWAREAAPHALSALQARLLAPEFTLYLGRKSCPLALPLNPQVVAAANVESSFTGYSFQEAAQLIWQQENTLQNILKRMPEEQAVLYWDTDAETGLSQQDTYTRRDTPASRRRWQFATRQERRAQFGSPL